MGSCLQPESGTQAKRLGTACQQWVGPLLPYTPIPIFKHSCSGHTNTDLHTLRRLISGGGKFPCPTFSASPFASAKKRKGTFPKESAKSLLVVDLRWGLFFDPSAGRGDSSRAGELPKEEGGWEEGESLGMLATHEPKVLDPCSKYTVKEASENL